MKKQSGFTLIELMVVMAIIAILATAGLSAYTGYIKKARDTTRIADISAMNTIVMSALSVNGNPPADLAALNTLVSAANNGQSLADPLGIAAVCLADATSDTLGACGYTYSLCDGGAGYLISAKLESKSNQEKYTTIGGSSAGYQMGSCSSGATVIGSDGGGCSTAGDICSDGTIYVDSSLRTTSNDVGSYLFADAVVYCNDLDAHVHQDWHLPSQNELNVLYVNSNCKSGNGFCDDTVEVVPNFSATQYWSSASFFAYHFGNAFEEFDEVVNQESMSYLARCVRSV